jgi:hypothetical protein
MGLNLKHSAALETPGTCISGVEKLAGRKQTNQSIVVANVMSHHHFVIRHARGNKSSANVAFDR